jgi:hypothetical protein
MCVQISMQLEGCQHSTPSMILLSHGSPKHSRKTFASDMRDGGVIAPHHVLSDREQGLHQAVHSLWAALHGQRWGVWHGTAEYGHHLVLLVQG